MSDRGEARIHAFGTLAKGAGGLEWSLGADRGGLILSDGAVQAGNSGVSDPAWDSEERFGRDPVQGAAIFRHLAIEVPDRGTVVCSSRGQPGIPGHSEEEATGRLDAEAESVHYEETLISTQYDAEGKPTRFGLELWPGEPEPANRAGATRTNGRLIAAGSEGQVWAGFFHCHTDGAEGLGTYLLWRP